MSSLYYRKKQKHPEDGAADFRLMHSKEIAVVGVSDKEYKSGYRIFKDLIKHGFNVHGINPRNGTILGRQIKRNLRALDRVPDIVIAVVPPEVTLEIIEECRSMGVKEIWMQPGSESPEAVGKAAAYGIKATAGSCFMRQAGIWR
ncbi:MAG: CoA-binding protein [Candidatus Omnitrophota bacterium]|jgi:predicted CoA-binding protein|nr:CoA-binding protein [Candidatus Omnitrophota bacterium]MDD3982389.1 CoA-binding protein [Candidatus Omnitrophota bacterium]